MKTINAYKEPTNPIATCAELFAGVGGFRIALARVGISTVFSNQWEPATKQQHASSCYVANFGSSGHTCDDVSNIQVGSTRINQFLLPKNVDLIVGGFPCQDYSVAKSLNSSKGLEGKKGVLWWEILRLVGDAKPKYIFLENVDRLLKSPSTQRGRDFAVMLKTLGELNYWVEWRVVNAADYGFPQRRIRVLIVAGKNRNKKKINENDALDIISKTGILAKSLPVHGNIISLEKIELSSDLLSTSMEFGVGEKKSVFLNAGYFANGVAYTANSVAKFSGVRKTLGDVLISGEEVPKEFFVEASSLENWKYLKGAKSIKRTHKATGTEYNYQEGSMSFPDSLEKPSRTVLTGEGGGSPSRFKHIIKIGSKYRRLTPVELERLNGFPDNWTKYDENGHEISDSRRAFFMGNALVVGLIERVARVLSEELSKQRKI